DLRAPGLPGGRRLGALAAGVGPAAFASFGTRGLRLLRGRLGSFGSFLAFTLRLAAEAFRRRAQSAADALALRLLTPGRCRLFGFGVGIELAAHQLDLCDFRAVAAAVAEPQDPRVTPRPRLEARGDRVEQLRDDVAVLDVAEHEPACVQGSAIAVACGQSALGDRDDPLDERPQLFRLGDRGLDALVPDQRFRLVAEHR